MRSVREVEVQSPAEVRQFSFNSFLIIGAGYATFIILLFIFLIYNIETVFSVISVLGSFYTSQPGNNPNTVDRAWSHNQYYS